MGCHLSYHQSAVVPRPATISTALRRRIFASAGQPFIKISLLIIVICSPLFAISQSTADASFLHNKIKGLLLGTFIGDALGGPIEFQGHAEIQASPNPPKLWTDTTALMDDEEIKNPEDHQR